MVRQQKSSITMNWIRKKIKEDILTKEAMCRIILEWWIDTGLWSDTNLEKVYDTFSGDDNKLLAVYRDAKTYWLNELGITEEITIENVDAEYLKNGDQIRGLDNLVYIYYEGDFQELSAQMLGKVNKTS